MAAYKIVLVRHGESQWNAENRFTGWTDVPLSEKGVQEAKEGGQMLKDQGYKFDQIFTSVLKRAIHTTHIILDELDQAYLPELKHWRLNERHYGGLQGLNKSETAAKHGEEQVKVWRRAFDIPPPALEVSDPRFPGNDPVYNGIPKDCLPLTESLKTTIERVLPFWYDQIAPAVLAGKKVLISAHGNSLRALIKHLDKMEESAIVELNIPTAIPLVYELDENLNPIKHYYLADEETVKAKIAAVAAQGKAK